MNSSFLESINPTTFTVAGAIVGAICTGDYDDYELNAIGNWIIFVGQYLLTYAAQMQLLEQKIDENNINVNSKQYKNGGSPYINNGKSNQNQRKEVDYLLDAVSKMQIELEKIKNMPK